MWITTVLWLALSVALLLPPTFSIHVDSLLLRYRKNFERSPEDLPYNIPTQELRREYDFIVIGAGTSGSTVTNRLTEVPDWSVFLLEAGRDEIFLTDIPLMAGYLPATDYNWQYRAQPQDDACLGINERRCPWPRGKGMGGTSIINYMIYTRGHPDDYNGWEAMGNPTWGWDDVLKYFLKFENAKDDLAEAPWHSTGGYLDNSRVPFSTKLLDSFLDAGEEMGFESIDYTTGKLIGFSKLQASMRNGTRCSASKAYLRPIKSRPNIDIAKQALATKILIDARSKRAYGVEFYRYGEVRRVFARKEVILSAGAINSPQLLMLSGVGPRDHLASLHIPTIHDAPGVGGNLQEHVSMGGLSFIVNDTVSIVINRLLGLGSTYANYADGTGYFTLPGGVEALGYIRTPIAKTPEGHPDMELIFAPGTLASDNGSGVKSILGLSDEIYDAVYKQLEEKDAWTVWPMMLTPESRGWVRLQSKNPLVPPIMYGNYFSDIHDLDVIVEGIKFVIEMAKTRAFQRFNSTLHDAPLPPCKHLQFNSDKYWACAVRQITTTLHHQCGTAKMGPNTDPLAVVDPELKVHGIQGLRVIDASIIPRIPAAHTNAVCYMIGEKGADFIKREYGK